jgi:hypothetical protein
MKVELQMLGRDTHTSEGYKCSISFTNSKLELATDTETSNHGGDRSFHSDTDNNSKFLSHSPS